MIEIVVFICVAVCTACVVIGVNEILNKCDRLEPNKMHDLDAAGFFYDPNRDFLGYKKISATEANGEVNLFTGSEEDNARDT